MNQAILEQKQKLVDEIADKMQKAASSVIVEYRGLTVGEVTELRRNLRAEEVEFIVYKNSMTRRAAEKLGHNDLLESLLGPNAIAFSDDAVAPSRVLAKFAKKHSALVLKAGIVDGNIVDADGLKQLSTLPNKEGMISMLLGCLQSPIRSVACIIKAVADAQPGAAEVVTETVEPTPEVVAEPVVETPVETEAVEPVVESEPEVQPEVEPIVEAEAPEAEVQPEE